MDSSSYCSFYSVYRWPVSYFSMEYHLKIQKEILGLEKFFPHRVREVVEELSFAFSIFFLSFSVFFAIPSVSSFSVLWPVAQGLFLVSFSILLVSIMFEVYFQSLYARLKNEGASFAVSLITEKMKKKKDTVASLFDFAWSGDLKKRLGISEEQLNYFISQKNPRLVYPRVDHSLQLFGHHLYEEDKELQKFLSGIMIDKDHFAEVLRLVEDRMHCQFQSRSFLLPIFNIVVPRIFTFDDIARIDIDNLEYVHNVHLTEKAIQDVISHFNTERIQFIDSFSRKEFISQLIESTLQDHQELSYGQRSVLPSDTRRFIILHKAIKS